MKNSQTPILDGRAEAERIIKTLKHENIKTKSKITLAIVLVGNDAASKLYVSLKEKKAAEIGVKFQKFLLPASVSEKKIINLIQKLNRDKKVTGIMLQLPLPKRFNANKIISFISPAKDVDELSYVIPSEAMESLRSHQSLRSLGMTNNIIPPTIQSILHLIKMSEQKLSGKNAVILCNSSEFAKPLKFLLAKNFQLKKIDIILKPRKSSYQIIRLLDYQIIITALGQKHFLKPEMIKKDAIVIDVGISRIGKKTFGDVHPDCFQKSKFISPVPGGVGPLTIAYLMKNLFQLAKTSKK
ncbi:MAG: bifunctional 5,10-methylenetetrahydrofolate dehydrogenase/5,10-methenyltetrahydrofolate cyclohydrolase [Patescibacteria group bacterium]|nr:bifunctional 5,10-methylenetetrahydrofolate dehydrogenase/5,10-methenyltetrahydrofolate cyclohydrolase [Patescibacteria group bacterium]